MRYYELWVSSGLLEKGESSKAKMVTGNRFFGLLLALIIVMILLVMLASAAQARNCSGRATLMLSPKSATSSTGTSHMVVARVVSSRTSSPCSGTDVTFAITAGPDAGAVVFKTTDVNGDARFTYTNNGNPGTNTIVASNTTLRVSDTATKTWVAPRSSRLLRTGCRPHRRHHKCHTKHHHDRRPPHSPLYYFLKSFFP